MVCVRDREFLVRFQNETAVGCCGHQIQKTCKSYCAGLIRGTTAELWKNVPFGSSPFHVSVLPFENEILTIGIPVGDEGANLRRIFSEKSFTPREEEIALKMLKGCTNREIALKLAISYATLKTHINNIYRKLGDDRVLLQRAKK